MSFAVDTTKGFEREAKRLMKRYVSLHHDIGELIDSLEQQPHQGDSIGHGCYKVRLAIRSKGKGKSGGARVISCVVAVRETVYLLSIYDKSEQESLSDTRLKVLLAELDLG
jgi:mRNA-degrading endonuclease RelE of RelBE toxin-antitoxin system